MKAWVTLFAPLALVGAAPATTASPVANSGAIIAGTAVAMGRDASGYRAFGAGLTVTKSAHSALVVPALIPQVATVEAQAGPYRSRAQRRTRICDKAR